MLIEHSKKGNSKSYTDTSKNVSTKFDKKIASQSKKSKRRSRPIVQRKLFTKQNKKIILAAIIIVIVSACLLYFSQFENNARKYNPVEITFITTASNITGDTIGSYTEEYEFVPGDEVYVYQEYVNISHETGCDFSLSISVEHFDTEVEKFVKSDSHIRKSDEKGCYWFFETNESWPIGMYLATVTIVDHISSESAIASTIFFLDDPIN